MNELHFNLISILNAICIVQGIVFGIYFIANNYKKSKANVFFGAYVIVSSLNLLPFVIFDPALAGYKWLRFLPCNFLWFDAVFLFLYVKETSILSNQYKKGYLLLIPGILHLSAQIIVYFFFYPQAEAFWHAPIMEVIAFASFLYTLFIEAFSLYLIHLHRREVREQYANLQDKELTWAKGFIIFCIVFQLVFNLLNSDKHGYQEVPIFYSFLNIAIMYWLIFQGIRQKEVINLVKTSVSQQLTPPSQSPPDEEIATEPNLSDENLEEIMIRVKNVLNEAKLYRQKDLTIVDVAIKVEVHPKKLSQAINHVTQQNFNAFINSYRIEEAKELLKNNQMLSIDGIADEVGFKSKSVFYNSFKQLLGTTPKNYQNEIINS